MAVEGEFPKVNGDILYGSEANGLVPVGAIIPWLKSFTNTPALSGQFVECNGQVLSNAGSVYNGQTIPNLNGGNRFLRGDTTSGGTGGSITGSHTHSIANQDKLDLDYTVGTTRLDAYSPFIVGDGEGAPTVVTAAGTTLPAYYNVVWIMRIK